MRKEGHAVVLLFKFMLPPPTPEGKLEEGFFAHFSLGQPIVVPFPETRTRLSHESSSSPSQCYYSAQVRVGGYISIWYGGDWPRLPRFGGVVGTMQSPNEHKVNTVPDDRLLSTLSYVGSVVTNRKPPEMYSSSRNSIPVTSSPQ
jgi:hypothetical protein